MVFGIGIAALISLVTGPAFASIGMAKRKDADDDAPPPPGTPSPPKKAKSRSKLKGDPFALDGPLADEVRAIYRMGCKGDANGINPNPGMWNLDSWAATQPSYNFHDPKFFNKQTVMSKLRAIAAGVAADFARVMHKGGEELGK